MSVLGAEGTAPAGSTKCPRGGGAAVLAAGGRSEAGGKASCWLFCLGLLNLAT